MLGDVMGRHSGSSIGWLAVGTLSLGTLPCFHITSARAQEADSTQLQEVVVTAQKRVESSKDVPASISVLAGDQLAAHGITNVEDIARAVPGVSFNAGGS